MTLHKSAELYLGYPVQLKIDQLYPCISEIRFAYASYLLMDRLAMEASEVTDRPK